MGIPGISTFQPAVGLGSGCQTACCRAGTLCGFWFSLGLWVLRVWGFYGRAYFLVSFFFFWGGGGVGLFFFFLGGGLFLGFS